MNKREFIKKEIAEGRLKIYTEQKRYVTVYYENAFVIGVLAKGAKRKIDIFLEGFVTAHRNYDGHRYIRQDIEYRISTISKISCYNWERGLPVAKWTGRKILVIPPKHKLANRVIDKFGSSVLYWDKLIAKTRGDKEKNGV